MEELDPFWQELYDDLGLDVSENFATTAENFSESSSQIKIRTINELLISSEISYQIMLYKKTISDDKKYSLTNALNSIYNEK